MYYPGTFCATLTSMNTKWNANLNTGNPEIDSHHKELFKIASLLDQAIRSQDDAKTVLTIEFLEQYVVEHFHEEEEEMKKHNFEGLILHELEHNTFRNTIKNIRTLYDTGTFKAHVLFQIRRFVDTLIKHILTVDIQLKSLHTASDPNTTRPS